jgi:hypothetical protein
MRANRTAIEGVLNRFGFRKVTPFSTTRLYISTRTSPELSHLPSPLLLGKGVFILQKF